MYTLKLILVPNFSSLAWFSFSSAVNSCHQLLTAVDSWWQLIWIKFDWNIYEHTKTDTFVKFQLSRFILIFINCYQRLTAVNSWWQLIWKKFDWNFYVHTKIDTCAKFQLSRLFFIFISCQQLLSAVDSWWQLLRKKIKWYFHLPPKADTSAKFQLPRLHEGSARECDACTYVRTHASMHRQMSGETIANLTQLSRC